MCSKSVKEIKCFNNGNSVFTNIAKLLMYNLPTRSPIDVVLKRNFSKTNVCCKCLYELLNVPRNATQSDIKGAYYKLSMIYHPDKNRGCEDAIKKFREITDAYEVLSNAKSRNQYDEGIGWTVLYVAICLKIHSYNYRATEQVPRSSGNTQATLGT